MLINFQYNKPFFNYKIKCCVNFTVRPDFCRQLFFRYDRTFFNKKYKKTQLSLDNNPIWLDFIVICFFYESKLPIQSQILISLKLIIINYF